MGCEISEVPEAVRSAVAELWRTSSHAEDGAFNSRAFWLLNANCGSTYSQIKGSRLPQQPTSESARRELQAVLQNFFRWNGAPWYECLTPSADETALQLHQAFLAKEVSRTYFAPLDRLDLEDRTQHHRQQVTHVRFGPNEILLLDGAKLGKRVRCEELKRFSRWYWFPIDKLDDFYWLIVSEREEAGPIWERTWHALLHKTRGAFGHFPVFEPTYPQPIEDALFVLLLNLVKKPSKAFWKPFAVPWTYSLTDDPFAQPPRAPDPSALTWTLVGHPDEEFEVPDRSEIFETTRKGLEETLDQRWRQLTVALAKANTDQANFHPLTKHFFVKALAEEGIDEILANISCIEATLQLPEERTRKKLMKRYLGLVSNEETLQWLDHAYDLRNKYLHSLGDPEEAISWKNLAQARWSVTKAVDGYLALTEARSDLDREGLLRSLED